MRSAEAVNRHPGQVGYSHSPPQEVRHGQSSLRADLNFANCFGRRLPLQREMRPIFVVLRFPQFDLSTGILLILGNRVASSIAVN
jgi:hypothetical protein